MSSQLFNSGKRPLKVQALLKHLLLFHPLFDSADIDEEKVYQAVFPNEKYNKAKLARLASESMNVVQRFIRVCCALPEMEFNDWLAQVQFYQQRGLDNDFFYALEQAGLILDKMIQKDQVYFYRQFVIETERIKHLIKLNDKKSNVNLPDAIRHLDLFYIISKMEFCSYLLVQSISTKLDIQSSMVLLDPVLKAAKEFYLDVPVVSAYYHTYLLLLRSNQDSDVEFQKLNKELKKHANSIPLGALKTIHTCMRNHLVNRYVQGNTTCLSELFDLFKEQTLWGTIYQDGNHILASTLQNAITVALKLNETDWAIDFLKQHENRINGADDAKAVYQFNLANILFHQGKYQAAQDCLEHFHFREMFYNLAVRRLDIKLVYETEMPLKFFKSRLGALKNFVFEQKELLPTDKYDSNNNFVKLMMQIGSLFEDEDKPVSPKNLKEGLHSRIQHLNEKVQNEKTIAEREWLLEKLQALLPENQK